MMNETLSGSFVAKKKQAAQPSKPIHKHNQQLDKTNKSTKAGRKNPAKPPVNTSTDSHPGADYRGMTLEQYFRLEEPLSGKLDKPGTGYSVQEDCLNQSAEISLAAETPEFGVGSHIQRSSLLDSDSNFNLDESMHEDLSLKQLEEPSHQLKKKKAKEQVAPFKQSPSIHHHAQKFKTEISADDSLKDTLIILGSKSNEKYKLPATIEQRAEELSPGSNNNTQTLRRKDKGDLEDGVIFNRKKRFLSQNHNQNTNNSNINANINNSVSNNQRVNHLNNKLITFTDFYDSSARGAKNDNYSKFDKDFKKERLQSKMKNNKERIRNLELSELCVVTKYAQRFRINQAICKHIIKEKRQ